MVDASTVHSSGARRISQFMFNRFTLMGKIRFHINQVPIANLTNERK